MTNNRNQTDAELIQTVQNQVVPISLGIIATIMLMIALYFMKPVLMPFVFALFIYFIMAPGIDFMNRRWKLPRGLAVMIAFFGVIIFITVISILVGLSMRTFLKDADIYMREIWQLMERIALWATEKGVNVNVSTYKQYMTDIPALDWVKSISGAVVSILGNLTLILIFTFFLLAGKSEDTRIMDEEVQLKITRYLTTKFSVSTLTALIVWGSFTVFDVPMAFMFGVLTFILNFIPNIGSVIAFALPIPVILIEYGYGWEFITLAIITALAQMLIGNVLDPKLMGDNLGMHPAVILLSLLFWGFLWGISGLFLAIPITAIIKLVLSRSSNLRPISDLMEGRFKV
jgi:AI-2 transport protein TqsA